MSIRVGIDYNFNDRDWWGGRNYFASLLHAIRATGAADVKMVLIVGRNTDTTLPEQFPELEVLRTPLGDRMHPAWLARQLSLRAFDTDPILARFLRKHRIDVLSHSGQLGPAPGVKTLPWLYDFQFMHLPELWQKKHINWARQRYLAACRNGDGIIVSSHHARQDLETLAPWCKLPRHVLQFVSTPVDFSALPSKPELLERYGLPERYFHLPNQFWANKNHRLAIDALKILQDAGTPATIVCTGKTFDGRQPRYFPELMEYREKSGVTDALRVLDVVPYRDTQGLMAHAQAVINPSRFEGWSTTVEEAKTLGKRLLLSDIPVHREQAPERGRFFSVDDPAPLASLMQECLSEETPPIDSDQLQRDYITRLAAFGNRYLDIVRQTVGDGRQARDASAV